MWSEAGLATTWSKAGLEWLYSSTPQEGRGHQAQFPSPCSFGPRYSAQQHWDGKGQDLAPGLDATSFHLVWRKKCWMSYRRNHGLQSQRACSGPSTHLIPSAMADRNLNRACLIATPFGIPSLSPIRSWTLGLRFRFWRLLNCIVFKLVISFLLKYGTLLQEMMQVVGTLCTATQEIIWGCFHLSFQRTAVDDRLSTSCDSNTDSIESIVTGPTPLKLDIGYCQKQGALLFWNLSFLQIITLTLLRCRGVF